MTSEVLQLLLQEELARLHLQAEHLVVALTEGGQWHAAIRLQGREFELGSTHHGGFFCRQKHTRGTIEFVPASARPLFGGHGMLVRSGLLLILAGMNDPTAATRDPAVV